MPSITRTLLPIAICELPVFPCGAFVSGGPVKRSVTLTALDPLVDLRGGSTDFIPLQASVGDYSEATRELFAGYLTPATLLLSALIPLTLQEISLSKFAQTSFKRKLRGLYYVIGLLSTCSEIICVIYSSITCSQLLEASGTAPVASAFALILRDYELAWVATTTHFMLGLVGFIVCSGLGAYLSFPKRWNTAGASFAAAALLWIIRLANTRAVVLQQEGLGNCFYLFSRYISLGIMQMKSSTPNVLGMASIALTGVAIFLTIRALLSVDDD